MLRGPGEGSRRPGLAAVAVVLLIAFGLGFNNFLSGSNLNAIALSSAGLLVAATGTMALLVSGNLDLSIGSQWAFISVVVAMVAHSTGSGWLAVLSAIGLGLGCGLVNGLLVTFLSISPIIVTVAMLAVYRGLASVANQGQSIFNLPSSFARFGDATVIGVPDIVWVSIAVYAVGGIALLTTKTGLRLYAIGGNRRAARLVGLPVRRLVVGTYAMNGLFIGIVALLSVAQLNSGSPVTGVEFELQVLTAVILGGVAFTGGSGNPIGVFVGVITIGVLDSALIFAGLEDWWQEIARGALLLFALAADQLLRRRRARRRVAPLSAPDVAPEAAGYDPGFACDPDSVLLELDQINVGFTTVQALVDVSVKLHGGEVVCIVGDNGAGKSTLLQAISGVVGHDSGRITLSGEPLPVDPQAVRRLGVETVFQQPALCGNLGAGDNLALGIEPVKRIAKFLPVFDHRAAERTVRESVDSLGMPVKDLKRPVARLSGGEQQLLAILRVLRSDARVVMLDEPTAALGVGQATEVLRLVRAIAESGRAVAVVTHDVEEVFEVADRVLVLQRGRVIFDGPVADVTRLELLQLMSGRSRAEAARTVAAITSERRRIERDLHDGAQQHLVNAALMLKMAADQLGETPNDHLTQLLATSSDTLRDALSELRDLSHGIHPAVLTERGLLPALESLAMRSQLPMEIGSTDVGRLPAEVETVAYFVVAEALTNAQKHAQASVLTVDFEPGDGGVTLVIADDGVGGADESAGTGLLGLRGRVNSVGGTLVVDSPRGQGTRLRVLLPNALPRQRIRT